MATCGLNEVFNGNRILDVCDPVPCIHTSFGSIILLRRRMIERYIRLYNGLTTILGSDTKGDIIMTVLDDFIRVDDSMYIVGGTP